MSARPHRRSGAQMLALATILSLAFAGLLYRVSSPWEGNGDWNGALWSLFARNFLRYGYLPLQFGHAYFSGPVPDSVSYYTHHSVFITMILTELYRLFGIHEAVARLAVSTVTIATAGLLYLLAEDLFDSRTALFTTLTFSLCPLTLFFGRMYNHEVFELFWVVACVLAYRRWTNTHDRRDLALVGVCFFLAALTAWPGYYLLPILALHHRFAVAENEDRAALTSMLIGLALFAFGVYVAHGYWLKGSALFAELERAVARGWFYDRVDWGNAFTTGEFVRTELARSRTLFTAPVVVLAAIGLGYAIGRTAMRRRIDPAHGYVFMLLAFGVSHLLLFKQEAMGHAYYLYYLLPGVAIAAGIAMNEISTTRAFPTLRVATLSTVIVVFIVLSARATLALHREQTIDRRFYVGLGEWLKEHTEFTDRILVNFHIEGPFVMFYADREVLEGVDSLPRVRQARSATTVLAMRAGRTPHLERVIQRRYGAEMMTSDGEIVHVARLGPGRPGPMKRS